MVFSAKRVRGAMRKCGLKLRTGKGDGKSNHEYWIDEKGRTAKLAVQKDVVSPDCLKITVSQMETKGICSKQEFKKLLRSN